MMTSDAKTTEIRRLDDGSIDFRYYRMAARTLRAESLAHYLTVWFGRKKHSSIGVRARSRCPG